MFFPVFDKLGFDDLIREISFGDRVYYFEPYFVSRYNLRGIADLFRDRVCLRILGGDSFLRRVFLFSLLRFMVSEAGLGFLYFTGLPIGSVGEFDLDAFDYVVIEGLDGVNPSVYEKFLKGVQLGDKSVVVTCRGLDGCSPDFLGVSCLSGFKDVRLEGFSYEDYKSIIQKKFNLTANEVKSVFSMTGGRLDVTFRVLSAISGSLVSRSYLYLGDVKSFINGVIVSVLKGGDILQFYEILLLAKNVYLNILPVKVVEIFGSDFSALEGVLFDRHFGDYIRFDPVLINLVDLPEELLSEEKLKDLTFGFVSKLRDVSDPIVQAFLEINNLVEEKPAKIVRKKNLMTIWKDVETKILEDVARKRGLFGFINRVLHFDYKLIGEELADKLIKFIDLKVVENVEKTIKTLENLLEVAPVYAISQFQAIRYLSSIYSPPARYIETYLHHNFSILHNRDFFTFYNAIKDAEYLLIDKHVLASINKLVDILECIEYRGIDCISDMELFYAVKFILEKIKFESGLEVRERVRSAIIEHVRCLTRINAFLSIIVEKSKEIATKNPKLRDLLHELLGVKVLRNRMKRVIKKLINTLERDTRVRRILEKLFDKEEISEITEELYDLYNDLANP